MKFLNICTISSLAANIIIFFFMDEPILLKTFYLLDLKGNLISGNFSHYYEYLKILFSWEEEIVSWELAGRKFGWMHFLPVENQDSLVLFTLQSQPCRNQDFIHIWVKVKYRLPHKSFCSCWYCSDTVLSYAQPVIAYIVDELFHLN